MVKQEVESSAKVWDFTIYLFISRLIEVRVANVVADHDDLLTQ